MAPPAERPTGQPTPGQPEEVPEHNETESGSQRLSIYNRVTEPAAATGNVKVFSFFKIYQSVLVFS